MKNYLSSILNNIDALVYVADIKTYEVLYINEYTKNIFGDIKGKICWQSVQKGQKSPCQFCTNDKILDSDGKPTGVYHWEFQNTVTDKWFDIRDSAIEWHDGRIVRLEVATDITERKKVEEELFKKTEDLKSIFKAVPDLFFRLDEEANIINYYAGEKSDLYVPPEEFMNKNLLEVLPSDVSNKFEQAIKKAKRTGLDQIIEYSLQLAGTERFFEGRILPLDNHVIVIVRNITERKTMEEGLLTVQKLESIGILAGGIAHDFNNLLTVMLNNVHLSKMHIDRESKEYKNLESVEKAVNRATNLTQQLLTFAKGGTPIKKTSSIIELIKESTEFALKGSNVKCEYNVADDLWPVEVDEGQMNQVIHNIILNADQSMPEGGTLRISTENSNLGSDTGLPLQEGRYVKIVIQDQGIGIDKERLQKIFDPYFTTKEAGRGLGLSISYSIIKNHNGYIFVESKIGTGTTFTIYLPASKKQIEEEKNAEDTFNLGAGRILLMDDDQFVRKSIGALLTISGYEIEYSEDGDEAVDLYQKAMGTSKPFDAVILDLTVPGGTGGKEAMKKLLDIDPNVKAIVSSGYSNDPVMANFREYGFSGVLAKPCRTPEELSGILHKVLKG